jgi:hypothetical protein
VRAPELITDGKIGFNNCNSLLPRIQKSLRILLQSFTNERLLHACTTNALTGTRYAKIATTRLRPSQATPNIQISTSSNEIAPKRHSQGGSPQSRQ